jgi:hypothetical protein
MKPTKKISGPSKGRALKGALEVSQANVNRMWKEVSEKGALKNSPEGVARAKARQEGLVNHTAIQRHIRENRLAAQKSGVKKSKGK